MDQLAAQGIGRMFGEFPGQERIADYLHRRARRELIKMSEEQLSQYLEWLVCLCMSMRTGQDFEKLMAAGRGEQPTTAERDLAAVE